MRGMNTVLPRLRVRDGRVRLFTTPWTAAHQAAPSMGFSRQEYWSGVPLPSPPSRAMLTLIQDGVKAKGCILKVVDKKPEMGLTG